MMEGRRQAVTEGRRWVVTGADGEQKVRGYGW